MLAPAQWAGTRLDSPVIGLALGAWALAKSRCPIPVVKGLNHNRAPHPLNIAWTMYLSNGRATADLEYHHILAKATAVWTGGEDHRRRKMTAFNCWDIKL